MRTALIAILFVAGLVELVGLAACATSGTSRRFAPGDRTRIEGVLAAQVAAWNRGDLAAYMDGYARTEALVFTSGGKVRRGWQATFDAYQQRYAQDPQAMGTLAFTILSVDALGADGAVALGEWRLTGSPADGSGIFSVVLERRPEGWRVVHDHTSSAAAAAPPAKTTTPPPTEANAAVMVPPWRVPPGWRAEVIAFPLDFCASDFRFPPKACTR